MKKRYIAGLVILAGLAATEVWLQTRLTWGREYKQFNSAAEAHRHYHPIPPTGNWAAIYTQDFAEKFNLSLSDVSNDLDSFVKYIEIISVPARVLKKPSSIDDWSPKLACIINMITSQNHDIPLHEGRTNTKGITKEQRIEYQLHNIKYRLDELDKPIQTLDINKYDASYRSLSVLNSIHSHDVLPGYDYFSMYIPRCRRVLKSVKHQRDITFNSFMKASVIEERAKKQIHRYTKNEEKIVSYKRDEDSLFITITIPQKLSQSFYEGTEVPTEPKHALIKSLAAVPKLIVALPLAAMMSLGAPDVSDANKAPVRMGFPAPWPEDVPTHFKLDKK